MKKTVLIVLALMMALMLMCAACGGGSDEPASESPEATELPQVTAPPAGEAGDEIIGAEENQAAEQITAEQERESWPEARKKVDPDLVGATLKELYDAIGEPKRAVYGPSCYTAGAEDGTLFYDGFYVGTTRFADGTEFITGTDSLG